VDADAPVAALEFVHRTPAGPTAREGLLGSVIAACDTWGMEPAHVTLSGDLSGEYVVEDRRPDGRVVLRPDLSVRAMLARHGERKLTPDEFEQHFGDLPTDGEG
jgi:hypothetical protein